jgi:ATPase subunit of ABC transporter with duplicated ATPase domains
MFNLRQISKSLGNQLVLDTVTLGLMPSERVGLVGLNGAGKTTLLRVIIDELEPDTGKVETGGATIGYLPQQFDFGHGAVEDLLKRQLLDESEVYRIDTVLDVVGLLEIDRQLPASSLSGGQQTRLGLAVVLMTDPDVLLLDEPTNNLDSNGLVWIESYIRAFKGAVLVVSHDRTFLDHVATSIVELTDGKLKHYGGNYTFYHNQKQSERQTLVDEYEKNQEEKKRLNKSIIAQREKSQHTQNHIKRSDNDKAQRDYFKNRVAGKYGQQAKALEKRLDQLSDIERPTEHRSYAVNLDGANPSSKLIVNAEDLTMSFDDVPVLQNISLAIYGNDRVWLSGPNGSGKSTLLKMIVGLLAFDSGIITLGADIRIGYMSQEISHLAEHASGLAQLLSTGADVESCYRQARSLGLTATMLNGPILALSRGQVAKLSFAELLLQHNHLLVLDEPTNHLEIETREAIEAALVEYSGALLVASHDRYFVEAIKTVREVWL